MSLPDEDIVYLEWFAKINRDLHSMSSVKPGPVTDAVEFRCGACGDRRITTALWGEAPDCCGRPMAGTSRPVRDVWP